MLRESKHCEGFATYEDGKMKYSCEENIKMLSEKELSYYNCDFYDMEEYSQCYKCPLECKNNKSIAKKMKDLSVNQAKSNLLDVASKTPLGKDAIRFALDNLNSEIPDDQIEAVKAVGMASEVLSKALSGAMFDIEKVRAISHILKNQNKNL